jgi:hypothetical protein
MMAYLAHLGPVANIALWLVALAVAIWIVGPSVGMLLGLARLDKDVDADPARANPRLDDLDGQERYRQFVELGFRPLGWTQEHGRFATPLHWHWRSVEGARWLASPDDRTFVSFYRVVRREPVRMCAMTLFEGGGAWVTACPGAGIAEKIIGSYGRVEEQKVDATELLARHAGHVERFRAERGLSVKKATFAELAAESLAHSRVMIEKSMRWGMMALPLGMFGIPAVAALSWLWRDMHSLRPLGAFMIFYAAIIYGLMRAFIAVAQREGAQRSHTETRTVSIVPVTPDGEIVAGRYERWVRLLAGVVAADIVVRLAVIAAKSPAVARLGAQAIAMVTVITLLCVVNLRIFARRALGRATMVRGGKPVDHLGIWGNWSLLGMFFLISRRPPIPNWWIVWTLAVFALACGGYLLERNGRRPRPSP